MFNGVVTLATTANDACVLQLDGKKWAKHIYPNNIQIKNPSWRNHQDGSVNKNVTHPFNFLVKKAFL